MEIGKNLWFYVAIILAIILLANIYPTKSNTDREKILENLEKGILKFQKQGRYKCCIEPACTMCYLGEWIFEKGECYCDDKIIEGKMEDVCPECKSGIEKGFCSSAKAEVCKI